MVSEEKEIKCSICDSKYSDSYYKNNITEEIICQECLLELDGITTSDITHYFLDGNYIGNDSESIREVTENICKYCNYEEVET